MQLLNDTLMYQYSVKWSRKSKLV